jgi:hypothetical protein
MFKTFMHVFGAIWAVFLGFVVWIAPHVDWSNGKNESLWGIRGLIVLGMTAWVFGINMWTALDVPVKTPCKCSVLVEALRDLMNFQKRSVLTSRAPVQSAFEKVKKVLDS